VVSRLVPVVCCGTLEREVRLLAARNTWPVVLRFVDDSLHGDPDTLAVVLSYELAQAGRGAVVVYGRCHPDMDALVGRAGAQRLPFCNCIEMLLGTELYERELAAGTYFLLESWARRWGAHASATLGADPAAAGAVLRSELRCLLCLQTCCSVDFAQAADWVSRRTGLPLRSLRVRLANLETALAAAIAHAGAGQP
jgi:hypothetical protein